MSVAQPACTAAGQCKGFATHQIGCLTMGGDLGTNIRRAAVAERPFPISGFEVQADWAVSEIVDFTYQNLVFECGLSP